MSKIYFVGAGSGAPDLITLRGQRLLQEADVIVYAGSLVNPALLDYAKAGCEIYDSARLHLGQVMDIMIPAVKAGKKVVRLHTGDPSIYGAIREQMDILEENGIEYEVCPGVSSFCGAAAAIKKEYTLPDVSQTLILTRMEGRTPVPKRESIRSLAAHGASMAIFLSASMLEKLQEELLASGGYSEDTPCAIVYKATWPDQKVVYTKLSGLAKAAADEGITKTALILCGNFLGNEYELSKLYDPSFTTEFRQGTDVKAGCTDSGNYDAAAEKTAMGGKRVYDAAVVCYTERGREAAARVAESLVNAEGGWFNTEICVFDREKAAAGTGGEDVRAAAHADEEKEDAGTECAHGNGAAGCCEGSAAGTAVTEAHSRESAEYVEVKADIGGCAPEIFFFNDTGKLMERIFREKDAVIFVSAAGIAVRAAAPFIQSKVSDPAVIVVDESCRNVIPVLSGHIGGANELAEIIAAGTGAHAAVTTASDTAGRTAPDVWAVKNGFRICDMKEAKHVAAELLKGAEAEVLVSERADNIECSGALEEVSGNRAEAAVANELLKDAQTEAAAAAEHKNTGCSVVPGDAEEFVLKAGEASMRMGFRKYVIGLGCRRGADEEAVMQIIDRVCRERGIGYDEVFMLASVELKAGERGIKAAADRLGVPFVVFSAEVLAGINGKFTGSDFVKNITGVDNICERSAAAACGDGFRMVMTKTAGNRVTAAVAERLFRIDIPEDWRN